MANSSSPRKSTFGKNVNLQEDDFDQTKYMVSVVSAIELDTVRKSFESDIKEFETSYREEELISGDPEKSTSVYEFYRIPGRPTGAGGLKDTVAVKKVKFKDNQDYLITARLIQKLNILRLLQHGNIVQHYGYVLQLMSVQIVMECMPGGTLHQKLRIGPLEDNTIRDYAKQILSGLSYLHELDITHGSLQPANIYFQGPHQLKLGVSFGIDKDAKLYYYMTPEEETGVVKQSDIWKVGCIIFAMIDGRPPWAELSGSTILWKLQQPTSVPYKDELPRSFSDVTKELLRETFQVKADDRPSAKELLRSRFFIPCYTLIHNSSTISTERTDSPLSQDTSSEDSEEENYARELEAHGFSPTLPSKKDASTKYKPELSAQEIEDFKEVFKKCELLDAGGFGKVFKFERESRRTTARFENLTKIAVKKIEGEDIQIEKSIKKEFSMMCRLEHGNIVKYYGFYFSGNTLSIIMEHMEKGSLASELQQTGPLREDDMFNILRQILDGVDYLHKEKIVHRNIKAANIFLDAEDIVKLADFGTSKNLETAGFRLRSRTYGIETFCYQSPEFVRGEKYDTKTDIWSIGCVVLEMVSAKRPWDGLELFATVLKIGSGKRPYLPKEIKVSGRIDGLLVDTLQAVPKERPDARSLLDTYYFQWGTTRSEFESLLRQINENTRHWKEMKNSKEETKRDIARFEKQMNWYRQQQGKPESVLLDYYRKRQTEVEETGRKLMKKLTDCEEELERAKKVEALLKKQLETTDKTLPYGILDINFEENKKMYSDCEQKYFRAKHERQRLQCMCEEIRKDITDLDNELAAIKKALEEINNRRKDYEGKEIKVHNDLWRILSDCEKKGGHFYDSAFQYFIETRWHRLGVPEADAEGFRKCHLPWCKEKGKTLISEIEKRKKTQPTNQRIQQEIDRITKIKREKERKEQELTRDIVSKELKIEKLDGRLETLKAEMDGKYPGIDKKYAFWKISKIVLIDDTGYHVGSGVAFSVHPN